MTSPSNIVASPLNGERRTIVIIEDNTDLCEMLGMQLELYDLASVCFQDGLTALEWLANHKADLIILDIMMPGLDGYAVCQHIRAKHSPSELPILMLSALGARPEARVEGLNIGANDFLTKPYDMSELIARIRGLLKIKDEHGQPDPLLSRYLSLTVRAQTQFDPDLLMHRQLRQAVVLFADLRGFTHLSTQTDLNSLTDMLDEFFGSMMSIVNEHGGLVLDLVGDELLAVFNIDRAIKQMVGVAVDTARRMQSAFQQLRSKWAQRGFDVGLGIGIHHGEVMLGNIGGEELMRYTATGNVVNLAHRLVEIARPGEILLSSCTRQQVSTREAGFSFVKLPAAQLKGIEQPQIIYKVNTRQISPFAQPVAHPTAVLDLQAAG